MQNEKGVLYIVGTPIGNLEDITLRALKTLKEVELVVCEDTRVTAKLLNKYEIKKPLLSYHQHSKNSKIEKIIKELKNGKALALVTDAGVPGISDPGNIVVKEAMRNKIKVIPIPGVSALTALISVAGADMQKFLFLGFPPHKKGRKTFFENILKSDIPVVYYDSVYRFIKNLEFLKNLGGDKKNIILGRELTKIYEEIIRGDIDSVLKYFKNKKVKGEISIIIK